jgi:hypothetical protein
VTKPVDWRLKEPERSNGKKIRAESWQLPTDKDAPFCEKEKNVQLQEIPQLNIQSKLLTDVQ